MHAPATRWKTTTTTFLRTTALLLAAVAAVGVGAGPASAADGDVAWTVRTASNSYGATRSSFSYTVNPGGHLEDAMVVANRGPAPLNLTVYAADGFTTDAGQLDLLTRDKKSVAVGAWVRAGAASVAIQPGKTATVPFTVDVPDNATPGDYVGGILTSLTQPDQAQGINVDRRLGIRITLRVGGELKPSLAVEDLHVDYSGTWNPFGRGDATVTYRIRNTGNAALSSQQKATVAGPFGLLRATADDLPAAPELLPGELDGHGTGPEREPRHPARRHRHPHPAAHRPVRLRHPAGGGDGHGVRLGRSLGPDAAGGRAGRGGRRDPPPRPPWPRAAQAARGRPRAGRRRPGAPRPGGVAVRRPDAR